MEVRTDIVLGTSLYAGVPASGLESAQMELWGAVPLLNERAEEEDPRALPRQTCAGLSLESVGSFVGNVSMSIFCVSCGDLSGQVASGQGQ